MLVLADPEELQRQAAGNKRGITWLAFFAPSTLIKEEKGKKGYSKPVISGS